MKLHLLFAGWLAIALTCVTAAQATIISASVVNGNGPLGPTLNSTYGTLEMAQNYGGSGLTRDTIPFTGVTFPNNSSSPQTVASTPFSVAISAASGNLSTANLGTDALYMTEIYSVNSSAMTLSVTGLNASRTYQFQFLHGEPRNFLTYNGTVTFTDSASNTQNLGLFFGGNNGTTNDFALITVVVSNSTSLSYVMPNTAGRGPSFAGMTIQSVPEPSSIAMLAFGSVFLWFVKGRRSG